MDRVARGIAGPEEHEGSRPPLEQEREVLGRHRRRPVGDTLRTEHRFGRRADHRRHGGRVDGRGIAAAELDLRPITKFEKPSISNDMLWPLLLNIFGFAFFFGSLTMIRLRNEIINKESHRPWVVKLAADKSQRGS